MNSNNRAKTVAFYTLGCKVNSYDTEVMRELFEKAGYKEVSFNEKADIYIVNTCTVTHFGDKKSRQLLRRSRRANPEALIVATGCYAQTSPEALADISEVDLVVGTTGREKIVETVENALEGKGARLMVEDFGQKEAFPKMEITRSAGHTRAYVKVQDGCRQFCSYCIVPYARGPIRSRDNQEALEEISRLAQAGYKEIVLTGIHIASFGKERNEPDALIKLIESAAQIDGIERIRLSSMEPSFVTREFLERLKTLPEFCPHFHLSLQSGSATVLRRMNRRYSPDEYRGKVELIREFFPEAGLTTDIIVGFPGETEEEFEETLKFAEEIGFSKIHIFPYSARSGTPAASYPDQVEGPVKNGRAKRLSSVEEQKRYEFYKNADGTSELVLYEKEHEPGVYSGYTKSYIPVRTVSESPLGGLIRNTKLNYTGKDYMEGQLLPLDDLNKGKSEIKMNDDCIFCKIIEGEIPSDKVYETDEILAFRDINPQAPTHIVVIPKKHLKNVLEAENDEAILASLLKAGAEIAKEQGLDEDGFRFVINTGKDGGQTVDHLHLHLLGGRYMEWPPG